MTAVQKRFGPIAWDLAATAENAVAGPFYSPEQNSLVQDWNRLSGNLWLNPPFSDIDPWAAKCATTKDRAGWLFFLTPASVGSNWFSSHVLPNAFVLGLSPRLQFVGTNDPYPKDLILSLYGFGGMRGFQTWRWK